MAAPASSSSGSGLRRKLGPLPVWAWAAIAGVLGYFAYRHFSSVGGAGTVATQSAQLASGVSPASALGAAPSAGSPGDTGQTTSDLLATLGTQQGSLLAALEQSEQDVAGLAASQIAAAQTQTTFGSFNTQTQPLAGDQPGGSNSPIVVYVSPDLVTHSDPSPPAGAAPVAARTSAAPVSRYFTYKRDVPLASGQTVHFRAGHGYYAV